MKKLIGMIEPFQVNQLLYVYEDGNKIDAIETDIDNFVKNAISLIKQYELTEMSIKGPKKYSKMLASQIQSSELLNYDNGNQIQINFI